MSLKIDHLDDKQKFPAYLEVVVIVQLVEQKLIKVVEDMQALKEEVIGE